VKKRKERGHARHEPLARTGTNAAKGRREGWGFPCKQCLNTSLSTKSSLTIHVRTVHEKRRDHACPHCAAAFGHACHFTAHVRTVHEKRKAR
jgi:hypothetical protein